MRWAVAYAFSRLFFLAAIALICAWLFHDPDRGANPYVAQLDHWLGVDALTRAFDRRS